MLWASLHGRRYELYRKLLATVADTKITGTINSGQVDVLREAYHEVPLLFGKNFEPPIKEMYDLTWSTTVGSAESRRKLMSASPTPIEMLDQKWAPLKTAMQKKLLDWQSII